MTLTRKNVVELAVNELGKAISDIVYIYALFWVQVQKHWSNLYPQFHWKEALFKDGAVLVFYSDKALSCYKALEK